MDSLLEFRTEPFSIALKTLFNELNVPMNYISDLPAKPKDILGDYYKENNSTHQLIDDVYMVGLVNDSIFNNSLPVETWTTNLIKKIDSVYDGLLIIGVVLKKQTYTRSQLAEIARVFNRVFPYTPVTIIFKYGDFISFANTERVTYKQEWREGEKVGKITILKDIDLTKPHAAHVKILSGLTISNQKVDSFAILYRYWQSQFSLQALNDQFYKDLQDWFYYAIKNIQLPYWPDYIIEKENIKNFLVRLLARTMFCWFVKEKGLIKRELLDLTDWEGNRFPLTNDVNDESFLQNNSYYRGILQNMFYYALNQKDKKSIKDFRWTKYLHPDFQIQWFINIPYLNGGIFDKLDEDNAKESIEDTVMRIPNYLFYGIVNEETVTKGKGEKATNVVEKVEHKGLNGILKSYKFTLDENTPFEEEIALDPEMLGLVFENLLAELDPNLEESTIKSIRKLTGSYYTPRKTIYEMVNDCLFLYLKKFLIKNYPQILNVNRSVNDLVYFNVLVEQDSLFCHSIVHGLDKFKMLDPACGSGAFPMGMLHRMVDILKLVDPENEIWINLKVKVVDIANRSEFKKILASHLDDYSRKLGIIRDSIYGIDIQPLAVQITKLRFFISLLIDQNTATGITPMPNIETKIICADSLKNIQADLFSSNPIEKLTDARTRYYQPDISHEEREIIANEIVDILNVAFPSFSYQITGKRIPGQNKTLIREWFKHSTIAAPFFNMDFFFPELKVNGGFDCVLGNPPYGGIKISDEIRIALNIESKDPYGAFIARFLNAADKPTPLKHGGVLAFIVSDTFMTIKSHLKLRKHLMQNYVHKMLRMHPDTFRATVNTVIMVAERNTQRSFNENHICLMADMTNISIHDNYDRFIEILNQTKGADYDLQTLHNNISNTEYAIFHYPQFLIRTNNNLPFFVASPKLFALMNNSDDPLRKSKTQIREIGGKQVQVRMIDMNGKEIDIVKLGDIADVKKGIDTGDNHLFLYQLANYRGNYRDLNEVAEFVITDEELCEIFSNRNFRELIKYKGFSKNSNDKNYFKGKYIIPYEKGGESDVESGWLPNYYVPNTYYIDWSESSVKKLFSAQQNEENKATLRNQDFWFRSGLTFSLTGFYAPTVRLKSPSMFDNKSSGIFTLYNESVSICILISKFQRYLMKNYLMHTVDTQVGVFDDSVFVISFPKESELINYACKIIKSQQSDTRYDYASNEQIEIDRLVYEAYGLSDEDVQEVENWYARRYAKLSGAQKANLRSVGKSDDYLKLYGLK